MQAHHDVYQHSGKLGPSLILLPLLSLIGATICSYIYAYVDVYSPIAGWISLLFVGGFAFGVAMTVGLVGKLTRCRNPLYMRAVGFFIGCFALYTSWVIFLFAMMNKGEGTEASLLAMFLEPGKIWAIIQLLAETGWYSLKGNTISGGLLWTFWAIEALIVVGGATFGSEMSISDELYCENCDVWCKHTADVHLQLPEDNSAYEQLKVGSLHEIEQLAVANAETFPRIQLATQCCESCQNTAGFMVKVVTQTLDKEGKASNDTKELSPLLLPGHNNFQRLLKLGERPLG